MTVDPATLFSGLPATLRQELLGEYNDIVANYFEGRWRPAELHAGRFCEVVYSILLGRANGAYPSTSSKPSNFVQSCRALEQSTNLERGLRILAARILPALYEIRNNRDVGHVGGEVDPNFMDSSFSLSAASWLMAELVRVFHSTSVIDAKRAVDTLTQIRTPAVWVDEDIRRVLNPKTKLSDQILLLTASNGAETNINQLSIWTETSNKSYLRKVITALHKGRLLEAANPTISIRLLPAGAAAVRKMLTA